MDVLDYLLRDAHAERAIRRRDREYARDLKRAPLPELMMTRWIVSPFELRVYRRADGSLIGMLYRSFFKGTKKQPRHRVSSHFWGFAKVTQRE